MPSTPVILEYVNTDVQKYLPVIDARIPQWKDVAARQMDLGSNFLMVLPANLPAVQEFSDLLGVPLRRLPKPMISSDLFLLSPYINAEALDLLLMAQEQGCNVYYVEQLQLSSTRPPVRKPFLVYCNIRGIISQHDDIIQARQACSDYSRSVTLMREFCDANVYNWQDRGWVNLLERASTA